jgi:large subunit ribosomal protein L15
MKLNNLPKPDGYRISKKRLGRGIGSGLGKTATRGHKGQKARAGGGVRRGFEGGQIPLQRRIPKIGFKSMHGNSIYALNISILRHYNENSQVSLDRLIEDGHIKNSTRKLKLIGNSPIPKGINIHKDIILSKGALKALLEAGGIYDALDKMSDG